MARIAFVFFLAVAFATEASAQYEIGTWQKRDGSPGMLMIIEPAGSGLQITYHVLGADGKTRTGPAMTVRTQLDGADAPLLFDGKPTGETMAIKRIDSRHATTIVKFQGKAFWLSKAELSPDGKVIRVENDISPNEKGQPAGKSSEIWDKR